MYKLLYNPTQILPYHYIIGGGAIVAIGYYGGRLFYPIHNLYSKIKLSDYNPHPISGLNLLFGLFTVADRRKIYEALFKVFDENIYKVSDKIQPQFHNIREEIKEWLKNKYFVNPRYEGFFAWYISNKVIKGTVIDILTGFDIHQPDYYEKEKKIKIISVDVRLLGYKSDVTDRIEENLLHEYCFYKAKEQEAIRKDIIYNRLDKINYYNFLYPDHRFPNNHKQIYELPENNEEHTSWNAIFKDPIQANIVLDYLTEFLSVTGEWIEEPVGRHLVALCIVLERKGYLKRVITNPEKANAFNDQFKTSLSAKLFQPKMKGKAELYTEKFDRLIPDYKPS